MFLSIIDHVRVFDFHFEAKVLTERWIRDYNHVRPDSSLVYWPTATQAALLA
jgi:hypothetical protein